MSLDFQPLKEEIDRLLIYPKCEPFHEMIQKGKTQLQELEEDFNRAGLGTPKIQEIEKDFYVLEESIKNIEQLGLKLHALEKEIRRLLSGNNYTAFRDKLQDQYNILSDLKQELKCVDPNPSQIARIEKVLHNLKGNIEEIKQRANQIEFVNRINEMQLITAPYCSSDLLISAPAGYGKTRLIEKVRDQLEGQNWLCIHLELSRDKPYSMGNLADQILRKLQANVAVSKNCGFRIGMCIIDALNTNNQNNVALLIDEIEAIGEDVAKELFNQYIPAIKKSLRVANRFIQLRTIFAGRYIFDWKQLSSETPLELMSLAPFYFSAVYKTIEKFDVNHNFNHELKHKFALSLTHFTGGHPGCMAAILSQDLGLPIEEIDRNEGNYYRTIILPVISEIRAHIPSGLKEIFDSLSVVRRFNAYLLRWFIDHSLIDSGLIEQFKSEYELEKCLLQTYLVKREDSFLRDDITRRLLVIRLRRTDLDRFIQICEGTIAFYTDRLKEQPPCFRPDIIAVELLFQNLQYFFYQDPKSVKKQLFESLDDILNLLVSGRESLAVLEGFIESLKKDWEFCFTFNYLLKDRVTKEKLVEEGSQKRYEPFNELIQKIEGFKGGGNNG